MNLYEEDHLSYRQIAKKMKCTHQSVHNIIIKYHETGTVHNRAYSRKPSVLTSTVINTLDSIITKHKSSTSSDLTTRVANKIGQHISPRTIRYARRVVLRRHPVHEKIVKSLTVAEKNRRVQFCRSSEDSNLTRILYSDEKLWELKKTGNQLQLGKLKQQQYR